MSKGNYNDLTNRNKTNFSANDRSRAKNGLVYPTDAAHMNEKHENTAGSNANTQYFDNFYYNSNSNNVERNESIHYQPRVVNHTSPFPNTNNAPVNGYNQTYQNNTVPAQKNLQPPSQQYNAASDDPFYQAKLNSGNNTPKNGFLHSTMGSFFELNNPDPSTAQKLSNAQQTNSITDDDDSVPLLEELQIFPREMLRNLFNIIFFRRISVDKISNLDVSAPVLIFLLICVALLFSGKLHFGSIYATSIYGILLTWSLCTLLVGRETASLYQCFCIHGYSYFPMLLFSLSLIRGNLNKKTVVVLAAFFTTWSALANFFIFKKLFLPSEKCFLILYPLWLFYVFFALMIIN